MMDIVLIPFFLPLNKSMLFRLSSKNFDNFQREEIRYSYLLLKCSYGQAPFKDNKEKSRVSELVALSAFFDNFGQVS